MNDDKYTIKSGFLDVGDGHKIYNQQWGNKDCSPIFYLHGGPGGGCKNKNKAFFDPKIHNVVFYDQRGSGLSTPFGSIKNNTTDDLVEDIEKLRKHLGFSKIKLIGGSWGSTLGLCYALKYPDNVDKVLLWGIFTGTKTEADYIQQGGLKTHFPDAWEEYISIVPQKNRSDTVSYYMDKFINGTPAEIAEHVRRWVMLESSAVSIDADVSETLVKTDGNDPNSQTLAILEAHYFINNCFLIENYISENAKKLNKIPIIFVQGRFDHVTPPETAFKLAQNIGDNCHLHFVPTSHAREGAMREVIKAYTWSWLI